jgi:hypothetical protein
MLEVEFSGRDAQREAGVLDGLALIGVEGAVGAPDDAAFNA